MKGSWVTEPVSPNSEIEFIRLLLWSPMAHPYDLGVISNYISDPPNLHLSLAPLHLTVKIFRLLLKISVQWCKYEYNSIFGIPSKERDIMGNKHMWWLFLCGSAPLSPHGATDGLMAVSQIVRVQLFNYLSNRSTDNRSN